MPTHKAADEEAEATTRGATVEERKSPGVEGGGGEEVTYVDPYKQILNPLELPANPAAANAYPGLTDNVDPAAPISEERTAQAGAAIQAEQDRIQAEIDSVPAHPAVAPSES